MLRAFSTAATGMTAQQTMVDVIANNLANVNTTGFKRSQLNFQNLLYVTMEEPGTEIASGIISPSGIEIGSGVRVASTIKVFSPGELENTGNPLDIAISGDGFLQVTMPNGDLRYTRDGSLMTNANGELVTSNGYAIEPAISVPTDATSVSIEKDGGVNITDSSGSQSVVGTVQLARFPNPSGLSGAGFLEKSNVQMVTELVNLITAQRAYEINSKAIKTGDDMLRTASNIVR